eukprot:7020519-Prymnesium_polylepis.1
MLCGTYAARQPRRPPPSTGAGQGARAPAYCEGARLLLLLLREEQPAAVPVVRASRTRRTQ